MSRYVPIPEHICITKVAVNGQHRSCSFFCRNCDSNVIVFLSRNVASYGRWFINRHFECLHPDDRIGSDFDSWLRRCSTLWKILGM